MPSLPLLQRPQQVLLALTINSGVSLNLTGITATVNGNITNNGNGLSGTGTLTNATNCTISGSAITIPTGSILRVGSGTFNTGGLLRVASGGYITGTYSNLNGNVTLQQNIVGQRGWRIFSHPFGSSTNFSTIAADNGITINTNNGAAGIADVRIFNNATNTWSNGGTTTAYNTPYGLFIRGLASEVTGLNYTGGPTPFVYSVTGSVNSGSYSFSAATSTSNMYMAGNPYPAPVPTSVLTNGAGKPYFTYQITEGATEQNRRTKAGGWIVATGNSSTTETIPVFGVLAYQPITTAFGYTIGPSSVSTTGTLATNLFRNTGARNGNNLNEEKLEQLVLNLSNNGMLSDRWLLRYNANAKSEEQDENDLKKLRNDVTNFYSVLNSKAELAVDARSSISTIPMGLTAPVGSYTITVGENNLPGGEQLYLYDKYKGSYIQLETNSSYNFNVTTDSNSRGNSRFEIVTQKKTVAINTTNSSQLQVRVLNNIITQQQATIEVSGNKGVVSIQVVDAVGNVQQTISGVQSGIQRIVLTPTGKGMYWLRSTDGITSSTSKLIVQ
jgi:hypothetical protein